MLNGQNSVSATLADQLIVRAADKIDREGECSTHEKPYVAYCDLSRQFGCEQCLYEGSLQNAKFISLKARETYDSFSQNYT